MFTEFWDFAFAWYNVPFTFLLGLCVVLTALQLAGLAADSDAEADFDADADLDAEADLDSDADADSGTEGEADTTDEAGLSPLALLAYVGVGKAPLLVVLVLLCSSVGLAGWGLNGLVAGLGWWAHLAAWPVAGLAGVLVSSRAARWLGRALPAVASTAARAQELVGRAGHVISPQLDAQYGQVHLRNADGTLMTVFATTTSPAPLRRGERVVLVAYDRAARRYVVERAPQSALAGEA